MRSLTKLSSAGLVIVANLAPTLQHSEIASVKFNSFEETQKQLVPDSLKLEFEHECTQVDLFFLPTASSVWLVVCPKPVHAKTFSRTPLAATEASILGAIMVSRMSRIFTDFVSSSDWI